MNPQQASDVQALVKIRGKFTPFTQEEKTLSVIKGVK